MLLSGLRWFPIGMLVPVLVVLLTARGIATASIGPLLAVFSATVVVLELPTGGMADRFGRRRTHVLATVCGVTGLAMFGLAETLPWFAVSLIPAAFSRALLSGPLEAWYVDEAHAIDPAADLDRGFARAESFAALALGAGALLTAALAQLVTLSEAGTGLIGPSLPVLVAAGADGLHLIAAWVLMRPETRIDPASSAQQGPQTIRATIRAAITTARGPILRRLLVAELVIAFGLVITEQVTPTDLVRILGAADAASTYAILAAVGFGFVSLGARLSTAVSGRLGARRAYAGTLAVVALAVATGSVGTTWALGIGYLVFFFALGLRTPLRATLLHARVTADRRATVLSVTSLVFSAGGFIASLSLLPLYAGAGRVVAFLLPAAVIGVGALVLARPVDEQTTDAPTGVGASD